FLTLSSAQAQSLAARIARSDPGPAPGPGTGPGSGLPPSPRGPGGPAPGPNGPGPSRPGTDPAPGRRLVGSPGGGPPSLERWQWVRLASGRWISEKDPGYPFLAAPFQALGLIRIAPLFFGALGCLGLFFGARRWLGSIGAAAAVGLFCSSGASILF